MGSKGNANITKTFLESILKKSIKSVTVSGGSNPGDNFTSVLFGINVTFNDTKEKDQHLLLKTYPIHPTRRQFLDDTNLFLKELLAYNTLFPEYLKLQKDIIGNSIILKPAIPGFVFGQAVDYDKGNVEEASRIKNESFFNEDFQNYLIMVDVRKTLGFQMADKRKGLDFEHCKLVVTELAKIHSLSLAYRVHQGLKNLREKFPFLEDTLFISTSPFMEPMAKSSFASAGVMLEEILGKNCEALKSMRKVGEEAMDILKVFINPEGVNERAASKFMRVEPSQTEKLIELEDSWVVGSHGDCWINNMLFKYDSQSKKPIETVFVDLQLCRENCLTIDLAYFIYTSTDHKLRKAHLNELLSLYYDSFIKFCKILNTNPFEGFTLENLKARFHRSKTVGFLFSIIVLPIILQNPETAIDMDTLELSKSSEDDEQSWTDMMQSMPLQKADEDVMKARFIEMIHELSEEGVL